MVRDDESIESFGSDSSSEESAELPVLLTDDSSKDDWIENLIELAVNAYGKRYQFDLLFDAFDSQHVRGLKPTNVAYAEDRFNTAWWRFESLYVEFDERFIDESLLKEEVVAVATRLFNGFPVRDDVVNFERYITQYFADNFKYVLDNVDNEVTETQYSPRFFNSALDTLSTRLFAASPTNSNS